jgi:hypothetical protein
MATAKLKVVAERDPLRIELAAAIEAHRLAKLDLQACHAASAKASERAMMLLAHLMRLARCRASRVPTL